MNENILSRIDWITILIYLSLISFGLINIYSVSFEELEISVFDLNHVYGKQFLFFVLSIVLGIPILFLKPSFFDNLSSLLYIISLLLLLGLFFFGKNISGASSWYTIGNISLQPSEFSKITVALLISSQLSSIHNDVKNYKSIIKIISLVLLPTILIIYQPDPGTSLVFFGLIFVLIREGLSVNFLFISVIGVLLFILTLLFNPYNVSFIIVFFLIIFYIINLKNKTKFKFRKPSIVLIIAIFYCFSANLIFNEVFEQRHRDRFNIILGLEVDSKGIGYNINQSKIAIGSGGFFGKGFLNGTQTKGKFVPQQHTDYIFSTIGEEWGFLGSSLLIILYTLLILRILLRAEKQTKKFYRIFSYSFASMLSVHFMINIGMTLGLIPTIGIPLPFISYGGSNLLAFSLFLFIHLNLDANRLS
jgi:rod shape determining protein RodA